MTGSDKPVDPEGASEPPIVRSPVDPSTFELPIEPVPPLIVRREELATRVIEEAPFVPSADSEPFAAFDETAQVPEVERVPEVIAALEITPPPPSPSLSLPPQPQPEPDPQPEPEPERDDAGASTLRPVVPTPASPTSLVIPLSTTDAVLDNRRPFRAALGLVGLVVFSALILTLMIGVAVGAIAIALRSGATG